MTYDEAQKKVQATKPKDNYMVLKLDFDYQNNLILPHSAGVALLTALNQAEVYRTSWNEPKRVIEINKDRIEITAMSHQQYVRLKMAALLNLTVEEVENMEKPPVAAPPKT